MILTDNETKVDLLNNEAIAETIIELLRSRGRVVLHWFTDTTAAAKRAKDLGYCFSVNAERLVNEKRAAITKALPLDHILTEMDGRIVHSNRRTPH